METVYLNRNPTAKSVLELVRSVDNDRICYDHLAFRTFGVYSAFLFSFYFGVIDICNLDLHVCIEVQCFI